MHLQIREAVSPMVLAAESSCGHVRHEYQWLDMYVNVLACVHIVVRMAGAFNIRMVGPVVRLLLASYLEMGGVSCLRLFGVRFCGCDGFRLTLHGLRSRVDGQDVI